MSYRWISGRPQHKPQRIVSRNVNLSQSRIKCERVCLTTASAVLVMSLAFLTNVAVSAPQAPVSSSYSFISLDIPAPDGRLGFTNLADIADNGDLVDFFVAAPLAPGFLVQQLRAVPISCEQARFTTPTGINNRGEVVGNCIFPSANPSAQGFLRRANGEFVFLSAPGATSTSAANLNDRSEVVGFYTAGGRTHGFAWANGVFQTVDLPHSQTFIRGINNLGQIVGDYIDLSGRDHGFIRYPDGSFSPIDFPGAQATFAEDINDNGDVVGGYRESQGQTHSFLLKNGRMAPFEVPFPSTRTGALGINQKGQLTGFYIDSSNNFSRGFVASPEH